jgi:serine/threonine-protein kinase RsbT
MPMDEIVVPVGSDADVMLARQKARVLAEPLRFSSSELTVIATAISEIARNIVSYAGSADLVRVMEDGYSTSGGLGLGLPGSKRLMDEFDIVSTPGKGTTIIMTKWER